MTQRWNTKSVIKWGAVLGAGYGCGNLIFDEQIFMPVEILGNLIGSAVGGVFVATIINFVRNIFVQ